MPDLAQQQLVASAELNYRKFDSNYTRLSLPRNKINDLPVTLISQTHLTLPPAASGQQLEPTRVSQRLNDYGIALMLKPGKSHFRQAEKVFKEVAKLGNEQGSLNLLRLYYLDGRLDLARKQLGSIKLDALDNIWSVEWYSALLNIDYGNLTPALASLLRLLEGDWPEARARGMDFATNYLLRNKVALVYYLLAQEEATDFARQKYYIDLSKSHFQQVLELDPENLTAHYGLYKIALYEQDNEQSAYHLAQYKRYKPDDEASGRVAALARFKSHNLDEQASPTAVYQLH
jgi:tetratricopeptide (TPR) repeat protein